MSFTKSDLKKLSTTKGVHHLLASDPPDFDHAIKKLNYHEQLEPLQTDLIQLQNWINVNNKRLVIVFEGGEFSGKDSAIRAFVEHLNPRYVRTVALPKPTDDEIGQWYFQRYATRLPQAGEIVLFDRSWYNRAVVEPVNGFCTKKEYKQFMHVVNEFERMILQDGIMIAKIFLSISKKVQADRIEQVKKNPLRRWEFTNVDKNALGLWNQYKAYQQKMFEKTDTEDAPWKIIDANNQFNANLAAIKHILSMIPWKSK
jgi:polyphosphate kinase 2